MLSLFKSIILKMQDKVDIKDNLLIRSFKNDELGTVLDLLNESAQKLKSKGINQWQIWIEPSKEKIEWIRDGFQNNEFFAVELQGQIAGMYRLSFQDLLYWGVQESQAGYIHSLIVRPMFSRLRLGELILDYVEQHLRSLNYPLLRLDCNAGNKKLCAYYERQSFKLVGEKQMPHSLNNLYEKSLFKQSV